MDQQTGPRVSTRIERRLEEIRMLATCIPIDQQHADPFGDIQHATGLVVRSNRIGRQLGLDHMRTTLGKDDLDVPRGRLTRLDPFEKEGRKFGHNS